MLCLGFEPEAAGDEGSRAQRNPNPVNYCVPL